MGICFFLLHQPFYSSLILLSLGTHLICYQRSCDSKADSTDSNTEQTPTVVDHLPPCQSCLICRQQKMLGWVGSGVARGRVEAQEASGENQTYTYV